MVRIVARVRLKRRGFFFFGAAGSHEVEGSIPFSSTIL